MKSIVFNATPRIDSRSASKGIPVLNILMRAWKETLKGMALMTALPRGLWAEISRCIAADAHSPTSQAAKEQNAWKAQSGNTILL